MEIYSWETDNKERNQRHRVLPWELKEGLSLRIRKGLSLRKNLSPPYKTLFDLGRTQVDPNPSFIFTCKSTQPGFTPD